MLILITRCSYRHLSIIYILIPFYSSFYAHIIYTYQVHQKVPYLIMNLINKFT
ncbi:hypothetical protein BDC45DRAFT_511523 [Circinella umbellata]|nr:hypothetical protein BDC45DRAFT_511523 [Circinella umbellata]